MYCCCWWSPPSTDASGKKKIREGKILKELNTENTREDGARTPALPNYHNSHRYPMQGERETLALAVCLSESLGGEPKLSIQASQPHRRSTMDQWDNPEPQTERQAKMPAVSLRLFAIQASPRALYLDTRSPARLLAAGGRIIQRLEDRDRLNPNGYLHARPDRERSPLRLFAAAGTNS